MKRTRPSSLVVSLLALLTTTAVRADERMPAVGRINNSAGRYCSGILLAPRIALTAAHCLFNPGTHRWLRPEAIHFLAGFDRGDYVFHGIAKAYRTSPGYDPERPIETLDQDWALLEFPQDAPATIALPQVGPPPALGDRLTTLGFAREQPYRLGQSAPCSLRPISPPGLFATTCKASHGFSGGPLRGADGRLLGTLVAGHEDGTGGLVVPAAAWRAVFDEMSAGTNGAANLPPAADDSGMLPR